MNVLKIFRKPILAYFLSCFILFISCEQYDTYDIDEMPNQQIDIQNNQETIDTLASKLYELEAFYKKKQGNKNSLEINYFSETTAFLNEQDINTAFLENELEILQFMDTENPKQFMINTNRYDEKLIDLSDYFYQDLLQSNNLSASLDRFEQKINTTSLNFQQKQTMEGMLIMIKSIEENGILDSTNNLQRGSGACAWAAVGLVLAYSSFALAAATSLATLGAFTPAMALASAAVLYASINYALACQTNVISIVVGYKNAIHYKNKPELYGNITNFRNSDDVKITSIYSNITSPEDLKRIPKYRSRNYTTGTISIYVFVKQYSNEVVRDNIFNLNNSALYDIGRIKFTKIAETNQDNICTDLLDCLDETINLRPDSEEDLNPIFGG